MSNITFQRVLGAIVLIGKEHQPMRLNPDALVGHSIVPADWEVADVLTTKSLATVQYTNGVVLHVEPGRAQVAQSLDGPGGVPASIRELAVAFAHLQVSDGVQYTAIGHNFHSYGKTKNPDSYVKERFLQNRNWDFEEKPLTTAGLRLAYEAGEEKVLVSVDVGEVEETLETTTRFSAILVNCNFHRSITGALDQLDSVLAQYENDFRRSGVLLKQVLED